MAKTLLLGLGGTGSRVVNHVVRMLHERGISINDGEVCCAVLDTNKNDNDLIAASGTDVLLVPTSKDRRVKGYLDRYANLSARSWFPSSPAVDETSMIDGAAQMRPKSRLAFLDIMEDGTIGELEQHIGQLLTLRGNEKIRVMIVSSLSGGTGAGSFIQAALWVRKFLESRGCMSTIRGIFLLPDIFINTVNDIGADTTEVASQYANAYASIQELNTITKIKQKGMTPERRMQLEGLFDSDKDVGDGKAVYDYVFFLDAVDARGAALGSIDKYEKLAARLAYMQLYAPIEANMNSEEDNLFKRFDECPEPVFGSCGTAAARYPYEYVLSYCALRAAQDSISTGWRKIDHEIGAMIQDEKDRERDGIYSAQKVDPRAEFMRIFEDMIKLTAEEIGKNRLFATIRFDVFDESVKNDPSGTPIVVRTDKVEAFFKRIETGKVKTLVGQKSGLNSIKLPEGWGTDIAEDSDDPINKLLTEVRSYKQKVENALKSFDNNLEQYAESIVQGILPLDMGDVNMTNINSVYGMLTKPETEGDGRRFVHPLAARYMLYKLSKLLKNSVRQDITTLRNNAVYGIGGEGYSFDNPGTADVEETDAEAYLQSKTWRQSEKKFIAEFIANYAQFNSTQYANCITYEEKALMYAVCKKLSEKLEGIIANLEGFFDELADISADISEAIEKNVAENESVRDKTIYVYASRQNKEAVYQSLGIDSDTANNKEINKSVINAAYGRYCAEKRPSSEDNQPYADVRISDAFLADVLTAYHTLIKKEYNSKLDLDFYTAVCREYDAAHANEEKRTSRTIDIRTSAVVVEKGNSRSSYIEALNEYVAKLKHMSAPLLRSEDEQPDDPMNVSPEYMHDIMVDGKTIHMPIKKHKTFWGFNPAVAAACGELGTVLGINVATQQNPAYPKNELNCYNAVYGIQAGLIPKFNELGGGDYYTYYRAIVETMLRSAAGDTNSHALIKTPHLDKTWHEFLPYISPEKQEQEEIAFFRAFWLAVAYGIISLDVNGKYQLRRAVYSRFGTYNYTYEQLRCEGRPIERENVGALLYVLRNNGLFTGTIAQKLEGQLKEDLDLVGKKYVDTELYQGLTPRNVDLKPVNIVVRYNRGRAHDPEKTAMLIGALDALMGELASRFNEERTDEQEEKAKYSLCRRIYDDGTLSEKADVFGGWLDIFKRLGLRKTAVKSNTADSEGTKKSSGTKSTAKSRKKKTDE